MDKLHHLKQFPTSHFSQLDFAWKLDRKQLFIVASLGHNHTFLKAR